MVTEPRSTEGKAERFPTLAAELVNLKVDVIVAPTISAVKALKEATTTIPIVMAGVGDPVGQGLVASLARPGRNVTGELDKWPGDRRDMDRAAETAVPTISRVAVITSETKWGLSATQAAAGALGLTVVHVEVNSSEQYAGAFAAITRARAEALLAAEGILNAAHYRRIVDFAAMRRLPAMHPTREAVKAGGLPTPLAAPPSTARIPTRTRPPPLASALGPPGENVARQPSPS